MAGNFSGYWLGLAIMGLMTVAYLVSEQGLAALMLAPAVFAFGLVAFGFLGMGPVTIAVDSYGPVTDNAQSVYELSQIEEIPTVRADVKRDFGFEPNFDVAKDLLEENDGAGNTFKATAKPVLIGTAVVGSTTMIFSIIMALTHGLTENLQFLSILHPPFLLGLITGGAVIYWFTGASMQAVSTGAYRAVEFIKKNIKLEGTTRASVADSRKVVEICTLYAQKGMFNIFLGVFFSTLAFAFIEPLLLHRVPDLDRAVRPVPGHLHGQRGRGLGQREEDRGDGAQDEGDGPARGVDRRRHRRRSLQGHVLGGHEPRRSSSRRCSGCWRWSWASTWPTRTGRGWGAGSRSRSSSPASCSCGGRSTGCGSRSRARVVHQTP